MWPVALNNGMSLLSKQNEDAVRRSSDDHRQHEDIKLFPTPYVVLRAKMSFFYADDELTSASRTRRSKMFQCERVKILQFVVVFLFQKEKQH